MKKITKATLHYTLDGKKYTCWTTVERANAFLIEAKKRNVEACYYRRVDPYEERLDCPQRYRCYISDRGDLISQLQIGVYIKGKPRYPNIEEDCNDSFPMKPGDPGWDPELTEWFYEDD